MTQEPKLREKVDPTDWIVSIILILCAILLFEGWKGVKQDELEAQMTLAENRWEVARERNVKKWQEHCVIRASGWGNELGKYYDPEAVLGVYRACVK